jgi:hypothetical protein
MRRCLRQTRRVGRSAERAEIDVTFGETTRYGLPNSSRNCNCNRVKSI